MPNDVKKVITWIDIRSVLFDSSSCSFVFFVNMTVIGACMTLVENLLFVALVRGMHGSNLEICGASVLISVLFELPIFQVAPSLIKR